MKPKYTSAKYLQDLLSFFCTLSIMMSLVVIGIVFLGNYNTKIKAALLAFQNELLRLFV